MDETNLPAPAEAGRNPRPLTLGGVAARGIASGPSGDGRCLGGSPHGETGVSDQTACGSSPSGQEEGEASCGVSVGAVDFERTQQETETKRVSEGVNNFSATPSSRSHSSLALENSAGVHTPAEASHAFPGSSGFPRTPKGEQSRTDTLRCNEERRFLVPLPSSLARFSYRLSTSGRKTQVVKTLAGRYAEGDGPPPSSSTSNEHEGRSACFASIVSSASEASHASPSASGGPRRLDGEGRPPVEVEKRQQEAPTVLERRHCDSYLSVGFSWACRHPWGLEVLLTEHARDRALARRERKAPSPKMPTQEAALPLSPIRNGQLLYPSASSACAQETPKFDGNVSLSRGSQRTRLETSFQRDETDRKTAVLQKAWGCEREECREKDGRKDGEGENMVPLSSLCCPCCLCKGTGCCDTWRASAAFSRDLASHATSRHCFCWAQCLSVSPVDSSQTPEGRNGEEGQQAKEELEVHKRLQVREAREAERDHQSVRKEEERRRNRKHFPLVQGDATVSLSASSVKHSTSIASAVSRCLPGEENASWLPPCKAFGDHWEAAINPDFCQLSPCCAATSLVRRATNEAETQSAHPSSPLASDRSPSRLTRGDDDQQGSREPKTHEENACFFAKGKRASLASSTPHALASSHSPSRASSSSSCLHNTPQATRPTTCSSSASSSVSVSCSSSCSPCSSFYPCCVRRVRFFLPEHLALQDLLPSLRPSSAAWGAASPLSPHPECLERTKKAAAAGDGAFGSQKDGEGVGLKVHNQVHLPYVVGAGGSFAGVGFVPALCTCKGKDYFKSWLLQRHRELDRERQRRHLERGAERSPKTQEEQRDDAEETFEKPPEMTPGKTVKKEGQEGTGHDEKGGEQRPDGVKKENQSEEKTASGNDGKGVGEQENSNAVDSAGVVGSASFSPGPSLKPGSESPSLPSVCPSPGCQGLLFVPYSLIEVPLVRGVESLSTLAESVALPSKTELFSGFLRHSAVVVCTSETHEQRCWRALKQANLHLSALVFDVYANDFVPFHSARERQGAGVDSRAGDRKVLTKEQAQLNQHLTELQHVGEEASSSAFLAAGHEEAREKKEGEEAEGSETNGRETDWGDLERSLASVVFPQEATEGRERIGSFAAERRPLEVTLRSVGSLGKKREKQETEEGRRRVGTAADARKEEAGGQQNAAGACGRGAGRRRVEAEEEASEDEDSEEGFEDAEDERLFLLRSLATRLLAEEEGGFGEEESEGEIERHEGQRLITPIAHQKEGDNASGSSLSRVKAEPTTALEGDERGCKEKQDGEETEEQETLAKGQLAKNTSPSAPSSQRRRREITDHNSHAVGTVAETGRRLEKAGRRAGLLRRREFLSLLTSVFSPDSMGGEGKKATRRRRERLDANEGRLLASLSRAATDTESEREDAEKTGVDSAGKAREARATEKRQKPTANVSASSELQRSADRLRGEKVARWFDCLSSESQTSVSPSSSRDSSPLSPRGTAVSSLVSLPSPLGSFPYCRLGRKENEEGEDGMARREKRSRVEDRETRSMRESYCRRRGLVWGEEQEEELQRLETFFKNTPHIAHPLPRAPSSGGTDATENRVKKEKAEEERRKRQRTRVPVPVVPPRISRQISPPPKPPLSSFRGLQEGDVARASGRGGESMEAGDFANPSGSGILRPEGKAEPVVLLPRKSVPYAQRYASDGNPLPGSSSSVDKERANVREKAEEFAGVPGGFVSPLESGSRPSGAFVPNQRDACASRSLTDSGFHVASTDLRREAGRSLEAGRDGVSFYSESGKITLLPNSRQKSDQKSPLGVTHQRGRDPPGPFSPQSFCPYGVTARMGGATGEERRHTGAEGEEEAKKEVEQQRQHARLMRQHPKPNLRNF
ncbi:hypothetical protein TGDOM2_320160 [Toxoplasma gondii GAB2-2007-GAL-DOM2]|uniref:Uncharacterized protein n=4 Tax=Toxoplasma gondii TaxID=5811 RepID=V4Z2Z1_TOXGV|nr:hypothetical protein TGVEG_320160 [Toxoplasma gondii VEG]KFG32576.1 hypothetical protein TGDOM2_320160 [Toxoplasma gondii GAB2-2007-GAL-DOM2]KFG43863.1 hypothetical protein TGP89_320160 [Toxoplasma gondii p89]PUA88544.1 hypothetical protein TGBR9_320160 [Toxoplasma gondii TgCATBr9]CEL72445.1 TPA: hypothetical protein BN1205_011250 [Toxoplasma gondii VEG]